MLSSSIDPADIHRAEANEMVKKFIPKPLTLKMDRVRDAIVETMQA